MKKCLNDVNTKFYVNNDIVSIDILIGRSASPKVFCNYIITPSWTNLNSDAQTEKG